MKNKKKGNPVPPLDRKQFENLFNEWLNQRLPISHWNSIGRGIFKDEFNRFFDFLQSGVETDKEQPNHGT